MRRIPVVTVMVIMGLLALVAPSQAASITYSATAVASGTLGGVPFSNALVTVALTGDTANVLDFPGFPDVFLNEGTATLTIAGLGTTTFNSPNGYVAAVFPPTISGGAEHGFVIAQFDDATQTDFTHIFGIEHAGLVGFNLQSALGPLTGTGFGVTITDYSTSAGLLDWASGGDPVTLTVTVAPVPIPEPASLSLLGLGLAGAYAARRRRRQRP